MNRPMKRTIGNDEEKRYSNEFKVCVAPVAIREELTLAELSKKHGVHPKLAGLWWNWNFLHRKRTWQSPHGIISFEITSMAWNMNKIQLNKSRYRRAL